MSCILGILRILWLNMTRVDIARYRWLTVWVMAVTYLDKEVQVWGKGVALF